MSYGQLAQAVASATPRPAVPVSESVSGYARRDLARVVDERIAWQESGRTDPLGIPPLFAAVRMIASHVTQLGMGVNGAAPPRWLARPRRWGSALDLPDLLQHAVTAMALHGAGYLRAVRVSDVSWRLDALHPGSVGCRVSASGIVRLDWTLDGEPIDVVPASADDAVQGRAYLLHIPYLVTPERPQGTSPVVEASEALRGYAAVERQAANLLDAGTYSGGRLETDQDITADTAKRYQSTWVENRRLGKLPVLGAGLRYVNDVIDARSAQFLEGRTYNAQQVCMMFGIPVDILGLTLQGGSSSLSYANAADNNARYRANCLEAFTSQIGDALSTLLPPGRNDAEDQRITWDWEAWEGRQDAEPDA